MNYEAKDEAMTSHFMDASNVVLATFVTVFSAAFFGFACAIRLGYFACELSLFILITPMILGHAWAHLRLNHPARMRKLT
jgi:hypothetical protein